MTNKKHLQLIRGLVCQQAVCDGSIYRTLEELNLENMEEPYFLSPTENQKEELPKIIPNSQSQKNQVKGIMFNAIKPEYLFYRCLIEELGIIEIAFQNIERLVELKELIYTQDKDDKIREELFKISGVNHSPEIVEFIKTLVTELGKLKKNEMTYVNKYLKTKCKFQDISSCKTAIIDVGLERTHGLLFQMAFSASGANQAVLSLTKEILSKLFGNNSSRIFSKVVATLPEIKNAFLESSTTQKYEEYRPAAAEYLSFLFDKILKSRIENMPLGNPVINLRMIDKKRLRSDLNCALALEDYIRVADEPPFILLLIYWASLEDPKFSTLFNCINYDEIRKKDNPPDVPVTDDGQPLTTQTVTVKLFTSSFDISTVPYTKIENFTLESDGSLENYPEKLLKFMMQSKINPINPFIRGGIN